ncbi:hypothetical protein FDP41_004524 [Naegleria fowleri]|uniref:Uncharacterized protein n=1 Tax=Naegleria fowleri TaxID=5763 RepID=A0A6A5BTA0_NAEFO|nr:uncharacterized protein FDP41_004524 [Naegleria fowleri]KAF0976625.1 hypothetical protein FDP41_004524 [Naegleria fowleri]
MFCSFLSLVLSLFSTSSGLVFLWKNIILLELGFERSFEALQQQKDDKKKKKMDLTQTDFSLDDIWDHTNEEQTPSLFDFPTEPVDLALLFQELNSSPQLLQSAEETVLSEQQEVPSERGNLASLGNDISKTGNKEKTTKAEAKKRKDPPSNETKIKKRKKGADVVSSMIACTSTVSAVSSNDSSPRRRSMSTSKKTGWLEKICSSIDVPTNQLILPPVVGNGGKKPLKFHTVQF